MTITVLNSQSHNSPGYGDPVAWSVTVPAGSDRVLVVSAPRAATAVTYAGVAMSLVQSLGTAVAIDQWILVNPPVGTANVSFTFGTPYSDGPYTAIVLGGVDQATPYSLADYTYNPYQTSPMTHTMSVSTGGLMLATFSSLYASDPTVSGGDTKLIHLVEGKANTITVTATDDGSVSFSGWSGDYQGLVAGIALNPTSGGGAQTLTPSLFNNTQNYFSPNVQLANSLMPTLYTNSQTFFAPAIGNSGSLTTQPLKNNTGTVLASETNVTAYIYNPTTGDLIVKKTGQTTNSSGVMTIGDSLIIVGTLYRIVVVLGSGAEGMDKLTAA